MNYYTAPASDIIAALDTAPGKVLQACCAPAFVDPNSPEKMIPARPDVALTSEQIIAAAKADPVAGIGAARHLLEPEVLLELGTVQPRVWLQFCGAAASQADVDKISALDPWGALTYVRNRLTSKQVAAFAEAVAKDQE